MKNVYFLYDAKLLVVKRDVFLRRRNARTLSPGRRWPCGSEWQRRLHTMVGCGVVTLLTRARPVMYSGAEC
jgi:hypothetical protein